MSEQSQSWKKQPPIPPLSLSLSLYSLFHAGLSGDTPVTCSLTKPTHTTPSLSPAWRIIRRRATATISSTKSSPFLPSPVCLSTMAFRLIRRRWELCPALAPPAGCFRWGWACITVGMRLMVVVLSLARVWVVKFIFLPFLPLGFIRIFYRQNWGTKVVKALNVWHLVSDAKVRFYKMICLFIFCIIFLFVYKLMLHHSKELWEEPHR